MKRFVCFALLATVLLFGFGFGQTTIEYGIQKSLAETYQHHRVYDFTLDQTQQLSRVQNFLEKHPDVDLWHDALRLGALRMRVPPHKEAIVQQFFSVQLNVSRTLSIADLADAIDAENAASEAAALHGSHLRKQGVWAEDPFFDTYRQYPDFISFMGQLAKAHSDWVELVYLGQSYEKRNITGIRISNDPKNATKPTIFYNGCQHAREWISPVTVMYIGYQLVTGYQKDATITSLINDFNWVIVPIVNTDGYVFTQQQRMWRKNRQPNSGSSCVGTDINRNWGYEWNTGGSSNNPCSDTYHGPKAFSAPEETHVADYVKNDPTTIGYIDFHSFSQLWMDPWGYSYSLPKDHAAQQGLAEAGVKAMKTVNGLTYEAGSVANIIYEASGGSLDWTYGAAKVKYSYAIELRDLGQYGFLLPAREIIPQGKEMFAGVIAMAQYIKQNEKF